MIPPGSGDPRVVPEVCPSTAARRGGLCVNPPSACDCLRLQTMGVHFGLRRLQPLVHFVFQPQLQGKRIVVMIQTPAGWAANDSVHDTLAYILSADANWYAVKCDPQVLPHGLNFAMGSAFQPRKNGIAREKLRPAFERLRNLDTQLEGPVHDGGAWVRREDIGPELSARITAADVHDELDRFTPLLFAFAGISENHVERRTNARVRELLGRLMDGFQLLERFPHQLCLLYT